jgi:hypothetical protein
MGNSATCTLKPSEIEHFVKTSVFTSDEIKALWYHFMTISLNEPKIARK